ncbi:hypothetical protein KFE25_007152 [Diacronema lutheri]|uniref:Uncharacterized protein n=1 Tax=Diacronema lutheri TaxID=2081491 RepID=A0A8J5XZ06_DIALT|nr:hypothetical protein KFE25_007152 [Diacronema lutheri]
MIRKNGDVIAIAFKAPDPLKDAPKTLSGRSQNQDTYRWPQSKEKKPLVPYYPLAERNRLPVKFDGEAIPYARFCQERNVSQWSHSDPAANDKTRFRTMNMCTFTAETTQGMPVGFTNQGIVSEKTRWLHKQLEK